MTTGWLFRPVWRSRLIFTGLGAMAGAVLALMGYVILFGGAEAITVVQTARVGGMASNETQVSPQLIVQQNTSPQLLIETVQTAPFARDVAAKLNDPTAAEELPARQYGGKGFLKARSIADGSLLEIRVKGGDSESALARAQAAADAAMAYDTALMAPLKALLQSRLEELRDKVTELEQLSQEQDGSSTQATSPLRGLFSPGLTSAQQMQRMLSDAREEVWSAESALAPPMSQETKLFAPPQIVRPLISSPLVAMLLGLIGGAAIAFGIDLMARPPREPLTA